MKRFFQLLSLLSLVFVTSPVGRGMPGGTVAGSVKGSDGAPFKGAFVAARSVQTKATMWVLSDAQGNYSTDQLAPGMYEVWAASVGYKSDMEGRRKVTVEEDKTQPLNFTMQKSPVQWSQLTKYQAGILMPEAPGKAAVIQQCFNCHAFGKIGSVGRHDQEGWKEEIDVMRQTGVATIEPDVTETVTKYLSSTFGPKSSTPQFASELPSYKQVKHEHESFEDDALNIEYVDYELTGDPRDRPGTAKPDKDGNLWMEMSGGTSRLNAETGQVKTWRLPDVLRTSFIHEILPTHDGSVWLTLEAQDGIARFDTGTEKFEVYIDDKAVATFNESKHVQKEPNDPFPNLPISEGTQSGAGRSHTAVIDHEGNIWVSGRPLKKFDPRTKEFTFFDAEASDTYGITVDDAGNVWFAEFNSKDHQDIGMVNVKTDKITKYQPPAGVTPRRIKIDSKGMLWMGDYFGGSLTQFNPLTKEFKVFKLPGPMPTPYGIGIDRNDNIWYASMYTDVIGRLDPKTGTVTVYPSPYGERGTRDMFEDSEGRMWYGAQPYYKAGYIRLRKQLERPIAKNQ